MLVNGVCLETRAAFFGFVGGDIARNHRVIVALQRQVAVSCNRVIGGELKNRQGIQNNSVIGIVVDGVAAQAVEQRTQVNQYSSASVAGNVNSAIQVTVRM